MTDLAASYVNRTDCTTLSWPKCYRCTLRYQSLDRLTRMQMGISLPYPVEVFGIIGKEHPVQVGDKYRMVIEVECHHETMRFIVESKRAEGVASEIVKLGSRYAFCPGVMGRYTVRHAREVVGQWQ